MRPLQLRVLCCLLLACLTACGGSGSSSSGSGQASATSSPPSNGTAPPPPAVKSLTPPAVINVYPTGDASDNFIYVMLTAVGSASVSMPLTFDTGSSGLLVDALRIFPASMVTVTGFQFPPGQTSIVYDGITVTNQTATLPYPLGLSYTGNLGFAPVTFGDASGTLTTTTMPVVFYYAAYQQNGQSSGNVAQMPQQGIFGANALPYLFTPTGSPTPTTLATVSQCSPQTTGDCWADSALQYFTYPSGVDAGFVLSPASLQNCYIETSGSCQPQPALTIGITPTNVDGFNTSNLTCPPTGWPGPVSAGGYPVCSRDVFNTITSVSGGGFGTFVGPTLFDTGTVGMLLGPSGGSFPSSVPSGADVTFTTPSGFTYTYAAGAGIYGTVVAAGYGGNIVGIAYFTTNSFFIDLTNGTEGFK